MNSRTMATVTLLMLFLVGLPHAEAGAIIDIPNGNLSACCWGPNGGASYGQIFTAPAGESVLLSYSFSLESLNAQFPYVSQVYAWNGVAITGPSLFNSPALFSPLPLDTFTTVVFSPSIAVTQGKQYIALISLVALSWGVPLTAVGPCF
jgi:hypothetical protein